jgi:purine/pyrimidine-nucleoside phosphorylase
MIRVNEYFSGQVVSLAMETPDGAATVGVMKAGEYEFGTSSVELMTIIQGEMLVMTPEASEWSMYKPYDTFRVEKDVKFRVKVEADTSYLCKYL